MRILSNIVVFAALGVLLPGPGLAQDAKVKTTSEANSESLEGAAQAPLRDLNVVRTEVPPVLVAAMEDPYRRPATRRCAELVEAVQALDVALGPDLDQPPGREEKDVVDKGRPLALGAVAGMASDFIPFRGVVRQVTGAAKHDAYVQAAITAGFARRAYLKGLGESRGCRPPATPSHLRTAEVEAAAERASAGPAGPPPPADTRGGMRPRYPVR